jgi:signal recognition particle subunit SRP72
VTTELFVAAQKLDEALKFLTKNSVEKSSFYEYVSLFAYRHGLYKEGLTWAEKYAALAKNSKSLAVQVLLYAETDLELAERYASRFPVISVSQEELEELEKTPIQRTGLMEAEVAETVFGVEGGKRKRRPNSEMSPDKLKKRKEKKKRRRRLKKPVNYDPEKKPDPERWIRLDRRQVSGKRRKGKQPPSQKPATGAGSSSGKQQQKGKNQGKRGKKR